MEPVFAVTFHKLQGQTVSKLIVVLNDHYGKFILSVSFESLYVSLSRIQCKDDIRIWFSCYEDLEYLTKLKPNAKFAIYGIIIMIRKIFGNQMV